MAVQDRLALILLDSLTRLHSIKPYPMLGTMARKRHNSSSSESEDVPLCKRARPFSIDDSELDYEPTSTETPKVNSRYGQKGAFPGLDDGDDDELFYGPANDGIEYLRMVR